MKNVLIMKKQKKRNIAESQKTCYPAWNLIRNSFFFVFYEIKKKFHELEPEKSVTA